MNPMFAKTTTALVLIGFAAGVAGCSKKDLAAEHLKSFQGIWQVAQHEDKRQKADLELLKKTTIVVQQDRLQRLVDGKVAEEFAIQLNAEKSPHEIDFVILEGPNQGKAERGIYAIEAGQIKLCIADVDKQRPTEFVAKADAAWALFVLQKKE